MNIIHKKKKRKFFFSIICATIGKENSLNKLCYCLSKQKYKNFELIICDQNKENFNLELKRKYRNIQIKFLKSSIGLSISRNKGIKKSKGNYLIFLDDDIVIKSDYLKKINHFFNKLNVDIMAYNVYNFKNIPLLNYPKKNCYLNTKAEIFNSISSVSFVISNKKKIMFDTNLGLGSKSIYKSGEETDLIIRSVKKFNYKVYFKKSINIFHDDKNYSILTLMKKSFYYGCGWSYVAKKNSLGSQFIIKNIFLLILNFGFNLLSFNFLKSLKSVSTFMGRVFGLIY